MTQPTPSEDELLIPLRPLWRHNATAWFFRSLIRLHVPDPVYYWLLDRLTNNDGWRPLRMRYPEHFPKKGRAV